MAYVQKDRVKETSTTTGTGTYTLAGAATGFQAFSAIGNSNTCCYAADDGTDWEVGIGTYTLSGTTLARTTILASSNSGSAVDWSSGTRDIFCTLPADKAVSIDESQTLTNKTIGDTLAISPSTAADFNLAPRSTPPASPSENDIYLDDGSNSGSGGYQWMIYDSTSTWVDIAQTF